MGEAEVAEASGADLVGQTIGKYSVVRLLGQGGMGRVYEALNPTIKKRVAIKILDPEYAKNREAAGRFTREAQAASAAESPHIVEIFDAGFTDDGTAYIVMELLRGESLAQRLRREGLLDPPEAKRLCRELARGLAKAHEAGIVHRDLKPDNVFLVDRDPDPPFLKILDFGVSKVEKKADPTTLTREGVVLGTPWYMSPEQAQGQPDVDARSDLFSVGAMLYQCVTGKLPFEGSTYEQIIVKICTADPTPVAELVPDIEPDLAAVIERLLQRERDDRIQSAQELAALLGDGPSGIRPSWKSGSVRAQRAVTSTHATDSTAEAPAVLLGKMGADKAAGKRPIGLAVVLGLMGVALSLGLLFVFVLDKSDGKGASSAGDKPATGPVSATAVETSLVVTPASAATAAATATGTADSTTALAEASSAKPDDTASSAADHGASSSKPGAGGSGSSGRRRSAGSGAATGGGPVTSAPPPPPSTATTRATGVAGDLQLQRN